MAEDSTSAPILAVSLEIIAGRDDFDGDGMDP